MAKFSVIMPAAGRSGRFKDPHYRKPFAVLAGRAVWLHSAEKFLARDDCGQLILVIHPEDQESFQMKFGANVAIMGVDVVHGGAERADSVERALAHVKPDAELVVVHDAARPCIVDQWITKVVEAARRTGAAILATPVAATLKRAGKDNRVAETVNRESLWESQTPQAFGRKILLDAYAARDGLAATDDAQLVERLGKPVEIVRGSALNLKITTKEDLRLAEQVLKVLPKPKFDRPSHPFADDDMWR